MNKQDINKGIDMTHYVYVYCPDCSNTGTQAEFCNKCGKKMIPMPRCKNCQRKIWPHDKFCRGCGTDRKSAIVGKIEVTSEQQETAMNASTKVVVRRFTFLDTIIGLLD